MSAVSVKAFTPGGTEIASWQRDGDGRLVEPAQVAQAPTTRPVRFLRLPAVIDRTGLERSALYKLMQAGDFPKPVALAKRATGWVEHEVEAWQQARMAARD